MNSTLMQKLERAMSSILEENIVECSKLYGFDASEAMSRLTMMATSKKEVVVVKEKVRKSVSISMPFNKMYVKEELCVGLEYNHGLFTQCKNVHLVNEVLCKGCLEESVRSDNGKPVCGTVEDRMSKGLMDFRDSKGRAPVSYLNYLKKKNSSVEEAKRIGEENGIEIEEEHFVEVDGRRGRPKKVTDKSSVVVKSEKRGRPKKTPTEVKSVKVVDLFASSVSEILDNSSLSSVEDVVEEDVVEETINSDEVLETVTKKEKKTKEAKESKESKESKEVKEQEKEAKKKALEEEKEAKKKAAEEEKEAKKKALEEEKEAKKKALEEEKEAKKKAAEEEKEAKKKAAEEEKEAKKKAAEEEKEAKKKAAEMKKQEKSTKSAKSSSENVSKKAVESKEETVAVVEEVVAKVQVEEFTFEGVTYWKSSENILYDPTTQDTMGIWCDKTKSILPAPEESDDELDEEEYESDDE